MYLIKTTSNERRLLLSGLTTGPVNTVRKWGNLEEVSDVSSETQQEGNGVPP